jgi:hypothetical protein
MPSNLRNLDERFQLISKVPNYSYCVKFSYYSHRQLKDSLKDSLGLLAIFMEIQLS